MPRLFAHATNSAGSVHTTEVVAGGTALNRIITARGLLQEMHYPSDRPTPTFTDSATSIFVANDVNALKRALWLIRRVRVLQEGVDAGEFEPIKIPEEDKYAADVYTKYLVFQKWKRHTDFINNMNKQREDKALARMWPLSTQHTPTSDIIPCQQPFRPSRHGGGC